MSITITWADGWMSFDGGTTWFPVDESGELSPITSVSVTVAASDPDG